MPTIDQLITDAQISGNELLVLQDEQQGTTKIRVRDLFGFLNSVRGEILNISYVASYPQGTTLAQITAGTATAIPNSVQGTEALVDLFEIGFTQYVNGDPEMGATTDNVRFVIQNGRVGSDGMNASVDLSMFTSDDLNEGVNNLYFTETRVENSSAVRANTERLDNIDQGAQVNRTPAELKTAYEGNSNTNAFTDAEKSKLEGIAATAEPNVGQEFTQGEKNKLNDIETAATADQTDAEIKTAYENNNNTNAFTDTDETKLDGIEAGAQVNVGVEYTQAEKTKLTGIDSGAEANVGVEYTSTEKTKLAGVAEGAEVNVQPNWAETDATSDGFIQNKPAGLLGGQEFTNADAAKLAGIETGAQANVGAEYTVTEKSKLAGIDTGAEANIGQEFTQAEKTKLGGVEALATADQTSLEIKTAYEANEDTNEFSDAEQTKLAGIETGAEVNPTAAEIKVSYEGNTNTNAYTDTEKTKLAGIEPGAEVNIGQEFTQAEKTKLGGIEAGAKDDLTNVEIKSLYESNNDTNAYPNADRAKLVSIESGAEVNRTQAQLKVDYENNSNTNAFTDSEKTKLDEVAEEATKVEFSGTTNPNLTVANTVKITDHNGNITQYTIGGGGSGGGTSVVLQSEVPRFNINIPNVRTHGNRVITQTFNLPSNPGYTVSNLTVNFTDSDYTHTVASDFLSFAVDSGTNLPTGALNISYEATYVLDSNTTITAVVEGTVQLFVYLPWYTDAVATEPTTASLNTALTRIAREVNPEDANFNYFVGEFTETEGYVIINAPDSFDFTVENLSIGHIAFFTVTELTGTTTPGYTSWCIGDGSTFSENVAITIGNLPANTGNAIPGPQGPVGPTGPFYIDIFTRATAATPTPIEVPTGGTFTYTNDVFSFTAVPTSATEDVVWSDNVPTGTAQLYEARAVFTPTSADAGTISAWSVPFIAGGIGPKGDPGMNGVSPRLDVDVVENATNTVIQLQEIIGGVTTNVGDAITIIDGSNGADGRAIADIDRTAGDGSVGSLDTYTITFTDGEDPITFQVRNGAVGRGISNISRTSGDGTPGSTDTYTIIYTDGINPTTFTIHNGTNGNNGMPGANGRAVDTIVRTTGDGSPGTTDTYTITYTDDLNPTTFTVRNGTDGSNGRGITTVARTTGDGTAGTTDTYTITFTDATTSTFTVVNGRDGDGVADINQNITTTAPITGAATATNGDVTIGIDQNIIHTYELVADGNIVIPPQGQVEIPDGPVGTRIVKNVSDENRTLYRTSSAYTFAVGNEDGTGGTGQQVDFDTAVAHEDWELLVPGLFTPDNQVGFLSGNNANLATPGVVPITENTGTILTGWNTSHSSVTNNFRVIILPGTTATSNTDIVGGDRVIVFADGVRQFATLGTSVNANSLEGTFDTVTGADRLTGEVSVQRIVDTNRYADSPITVQGSDTVIAGGVILPDVTTGTLATDNTLLGRDSDGNLVEAAVSVGRTEAEVNTQIDAIRTSSALLTFPDGDTFTGGTTTQVEFEEEFTVTTNITLSDPQIIFTSADEATRFIEALPATGSVTVDLNGTSYTFSDVGNFARDDEEVNYLTGTGGTVAPAWPTNTTGVALVADARENLNILRIGGGLIGNQDAANETTLSVSLEEDDIPVEIARVDDLPPTQVITSGDEGDVATMQGAVIAVNAGADTEISPFIRVSGDAASAAFVLENIIPFLNEFSMSGTNFTGTATRPFISPTSFTTDREAMVTASGRTATVPVGTNITISSTGAIIFAGVTGLGSSFTVQNISAHQAATTILHTDQQLDVVGNREFRTDVDGHGVLEVPFYSVGDQQDFRANFLNTNLSLPQNSNVTITETTGVSRELVGDVRYQLNGVTSAYVTGNDITVSGIVAADSSRLGTSRSHYAVLVTPTHRVILYSSATVASGALTYEILNGYSDGSTTPLTTTQLSTQLTAAALRNSQVFVLGNVREALDLDAQHTAQAISISHRQGDTVADVSLINDQFFFGSPIVNYDWGTRRITEPARPGIPATTYATQVVFFAANGAFHLGQGVAINNSPDLVGTITEVIPGGSETFYSMVPSRESFNGTQSAAETLGSFDGVVDSSVYPAIRYHENTGLSTLQIGTVSGIEQTALTITEANGTTTLKFPQNGVAFEPNATIPSTATPIPLSNLYNGRDYYTLSGAGGGGGITRITTQAQWDALNTTTNVDTLIMGGTTTDAALAGAARISGLADGTLIRLSGIDPVIAPAGASMTSVLQLPVYSTAQATEASVPLVAGTGLVDTGLFRANLGSGDYMVAAGGLNPGTYTDPGFAMSFASPNVTTTTPGRVATRYTIEEAIQLLGASATITNAGAYDANGLVNDAGNLITLRTNTTDTGGWLVIGIGTRTGGGAANPHAAVEVIRLTENGLTSAAAPGDGGQVFLPTTPYIRAGTIIAGTPGVDLTLIGGHLGAAPPTAPGSTMDWNVSLALRDRRQSLI